MATTDTRYASGITTNGGAGMANITGAPDGTYSTNSSSDSWDTLCSIGNPATALAAGQDAQSVTVYLRKDATGGNGNPTITIELYDAIIGKVRDLVTTAAVTDSTTSLSATFSASEVSSGTNVQINLVAAGVGGTPSGRRTVQVDAVQVDFWVEESSLSAPVGQAPETDAPQSITPTITRRYVTVSQAVETETAQGVGVQTPINVPVGQAVETETAQGVGVQAPIGAPVGQALEADSTTHVAYGSFDHYALPITAVLSPPSLPEINPADESGVAQPITPAITHRYIAVGQAVETDSASTVASQVFSFVAAASANGRYLVDASGNPVTNLFDTIWPMVQIAGRDSAGDWQADMDLWVDTRAAQGFTGLKWVLLPAEINGAPADLLTHDDVSPFDTNDPTTANIGALNETYWQRVDYLLDAAAAKGLTCWVHVMYKDDVSHPTGGTGWLEGHANADYTAFGTALGNRYKDKPNLVWVYGGDYFDESAAQMELLADAITATGDSHLITVQNNADSQSASYWTTSRYRSDTETQMVLGNAIATVDGLYTYGQLYLAAQYAWQDTPTLPVVYYDGYYDGGDALRLRRDMGWQLTSGVYASHYGDEGLWDQSPGWKTGLNPAPTLVNMLGIVESLTGWHELVPDWSSTFVTAGRGSGTSYVTAAKTADGSLAFIYMPAATSQTITVDDAQMAAGYTARWVDPIDGTSVAASTGTTYTKTGANSAGGADWFLVLEAPTSASVPVGQVSGSDTALAVSWVKRVSLGQVVGSGTALAIRSRKSAAASQVVESEIALPLGAAVARVVGQVVESSVALPLSAAAAKVAGQVVESEAAQPVAVEISRRYVTVGQVVESDQALPPSTSGNKNTPVSVTLEPETAMPVAARKTVSVAQAGESSTAQGLSSTRTVVLGGCTQTEAAHALAATKQRGVSQALEGEAAQPIAAVVTHRYVGVSQALETDSSIVVSTAGNRNLAVGTALEPEIAQPVAPAVSGRYVPVGQAVENSTPQALSQEKTTTLGQVPEGETAHALAATITRRYVPVGTATEAEASQPLEIEGNKRIAVGQAVENSTPVAISRAKTLSTGQCLAVESAGAVVVVRRVSVGTAAEADQSRGVTSDLGPVGETSTAQPVSAVKRVAVVTASESGSGLSIEVKRIVHVGTVLESDLARRLEFQGGDKFRDLDRATSTEVALSIRLGRDVQIYAASRPTTSLKASRPRLTDLVATRPEK